MAGIDSTVVAVALITRPGRPAPARPALIQTPVPYLTCPVAPAAHQDTPAG
ncbi:MAG TPA: hypothetical protein VGH27_33275 [Streptosporangiaceae bacterium]